ncbi:MAG TPA: RHS repeat-associated core domain-containing protein [Chryseolinea sp.]|nr:RHS repeat-associated core domain-containing protein [Chryseolinea sp.]
MTHVDSKRVRVSEDAGFDPPEASLPNQHKRVYFENEIVIPPTGKYIYLWVSNESENTKVWFDDFTVTHLSTFVAQATDFGVWGDVLREQKADASSRYRFGYQGQFSEKDEETGWNHFELREYDPIIGRWNGKDAYKQYWSPYIGMGNNPVSGIDRDGGFRTRFGAWLYKIGNGGGDLEQAIGGANAGEWYVGNQIGYNGLGVAYQRKFDWGNGNKSFGDHVWNHPFTRYQIPDFVTIGAGYNGIAMAGAGTSFEMNWVLRGQEASWKPAITVTQSLGVGYSVDATINVGGANYLGNANDIRRSMLVTSIGEGGVTYWRSAGVALGGKIGVTGAYTPTTTGYGIIGRYLNVGGGLPLGELPFNAAGGVSNTFIIKDFHKK